MKSSPLKLTLNEALQVCAATIGELAGKGQVPLLVVPTEAQARQLNIDYREYTAVTDQHFMDNKMSQTWGGPIYIIVEGIKNEKEKSIEEKITGRDAIVRKKNTFRASDSF